MACFSFLKLTLLVTLSIFLVYFLPSTKASPGDNSNEFKTCVATCLKETCSLNPSLPLILQLFAWSCKDDCSYKCMHQITTHAIETRGEIVQYYGKWPFYRLWGIQEPASVLFSFLNGFMHYRYLKVMKNQISDNYYMKNIYFGYAYACINTWFWSSVYHTRDFPETEKLDYFSAAFSILFSVFFTTIRVFDLRTPKTIILGALCFLAFILHVSYLTFVKFDYGYNILANGSVGAVHNFIWIWWSIRNWRKRPDDAWKPLSAVLYITVAMCLEIFDFPPIWGILDAHALWHASTIPLVGFWYDFLIQDAKIEVLRKSKGKMRLE
ncbi:hypothetical protein G9A89_005536 [Geosiphon pyriformis]|nr:hypothetical protein G9A89_005536 [Geosiphon pyriformis]